MHLLPGDGGYGLPHYGDLLLGPRRRGTLSRSSARLWTAPLSVIRTTADVASHRVSLAWLEPPTFRAVRPVHTPTLLPLRWPPT